MKHSFNKLRRFMLPVIVMIGLAFVVLSSDTAWAVFACNGTNAPAPCFSSRGLPGTCDNDKGCVENGDPDGTCTFDDEYNKTSVGSEAGIISVIIKNVIASLQPIAQKMFTGITSDTGFQKTLEAAMTLYVIIYAVTFMFGMVQVTVFDFFIRMVKLGLVAMLISGTAASVFSKTFVHFFNDGTDSIITQVSTITSSNGIAVSADPFQWMDDTILELTSVKMMVTLMAAASTGPYGWIIIGILTISLYTFIKSMLYALWVYVMSLTMRTLLFGIAPLFLSCAMFTRTRHLFDGWLNQVVNSCLQPIFLFTFFSFFLQLIKSQFDLITGLDVCWTEQALFAGAPNQAHYWRFAVWDCTAHIWVPFDGQWGFKGPINTGCKQNPVHPLGIMLPLTLLILTDVAKRFNYIVVSIAKDIANASTSFDFRGRPGFGGRVGGGKKSAPPKPPTPPRAGPPSLFGRESLATTHRPNRGRSAEEAQRRISELAGRRDKRPR